MKKPVSTKALLPTSQLTTLQAWIDFAESAYARCQASLGQVATTAHDEALYLFLRTLEWPLDSHPRILAKKLTPDQRVALRTILTRRLIDGVPAAYLTHEAFLGEYRFYVDERVIIPRSYFLEIIPGQLDQWLRQPAKVKRVVDVCTGSGCLAILLAQHFPKAKVDAIDLSAGALAVARQNVAAYQLGDRVRLHQSDVFDDVSAVKYEVILSNPPYETSDQVDALPREFHQEPRLALDGGADGLDIIRKLLRQSRTRLTEEGIVLIEVGGLQDAMNKEFSKLDLHWLHTEDGADCVCVIHAQKLRNWKG